MTTNGKAFGKVTAVAGASRPGWGRCVARLLRDCRGQDLIEYALLTSIIGVAGVLALAAFSGRMGTTYGTWNTSAQEAWEPCPPGGCS
jgi:Flp pilus assembly pilin Flp